MTKQSDIENLFQKYLANACDEQETRRLLKYFEDESNASYLKECISEYLPEHYDMDDEFRKEMGKSFIQTDEFISNLVSADIQSKPRSAIFRFGRYIVAACFVLFMAFGFYTYMNRIPGNPKTNSHVSLLVLPSGQIDSLESKYVNERVLIEKNGLALIQEKENFLKIVRTANESKPVDPEMYSIRAAKGRQLRLKLIDGSVVALNSLSELSFTLDFSSDKRWLELKGEGYFDIVSNPNLPLFVKTPDQLIQVYGTKFNVRNYSDDEEVKTTLFHGKVSVKKVKGVSGSEHILKPGEQVVLKKNDDNVTQKKIDNEVEVLAWTSNKFVYEGTSLKEIMKDFSRWYDVEVDWNTIPEFRYEGTIPHEYSLEEALKLLEKTGNIKINLHNNRITF
ncbi:FecR family protein [Pedobacter nyackensis]|uniref:FecR family protein n=1 Tax=Pedobacter nyackensis TaxID=475255 RepID=UPI00292EC881|nr:FecR family protein [Pedobacter nyackensis]